MKVYLHAQGPFRRDDSFGRRDGPPSFREGMREGGRGDGGGRGGGPPFPEDRGGGGPTPRGDREGYWPPPPPMQQRPLGRDISPPYSEHNSREPTPTRQVDAEDPRAHSRGEAAAAGVREGGGGRLRMGGGARAGGRMWRLDERTGARDDASGGGGEPGSAPGSARSAGGGDGFSRVERGEPELSRGPPPPLRPESPHVGGYKAAAAAAAAGDPPRLTHASSTTSLSSAQGGAGGGGLLPSRSSLKAFMQSREAPPPAEALPGPPPPAGASGFGYGQRSVAPEGSASGLGFSQAPGFGLGQQRLPPPPPVDLLPLGGRSGSALLPSELSLRQHFSSDHHLPASSSGMPHVASIRVAPSFSSGGVAGAGALQRMASASDLLSPQGSYLSDAGGGSMLSPAAGGGGGGAAQQAGRRFGFGISRRASTLPLKEAGGGDEQVEGDGTGPAAMEGGEEGDATATVDDNQMQVDSEAAGEAAEGEGLGGPVKAEEGEEEEGEEDGGAPVPHSLTIKVETDAVGGDEAGRTMQEGQAPLLLGVDAIGDQIELLETEISDLERLTSTLQLSSKQVKGHS